MYLTKCVEEITYLLTPPAQPPPQQPGMHGLGNGAGFLGHGDASMEEMYMQQHRQKMQSQLPTLPTSNPWPTTTRASPTTHRCTLPHR